MEESDFHNGKCYIVMSLKRNGVLATRKWVKGGVSGTGKIGKMLLKNTISLMIKIGKMLLKIMGNMGRRKKGKMMGMLWKMEG